MCEPTRYLNPQFCWPDDLKLEDVLDLREFAKKSTMVMVGVGCVCALMGMCCGVLITLAMTSKRDSCVINKEEDVRWSGEMCA